MRYLSASLLAAQRANTGVPLITMAPGLGATVLVRNPSSGDKLIALHELIVDSANPGQLFGVGYPNETQSGGTSAWVGKLNATDLDIITSKLYNDTGEHAQFVGISQDDTHLYVAGMDYTGGDTLMVTKYLKSDMSVVASVSWTTATTDTNYIGCGIDAVGDYVYVAASTTEGATSYGTYIAELNKSDLSINADYYSQEAAAGVPDSVYYHCACDGTNVFAVGYETIAGYKAIIDKFDVAGLGNPTGTVLTYGTSVQLTGVAYDDTHLYAVGYDNIATDIGIVFKILKSDLSVVAAASYTDNDGECRFNCVVSDGDVIYVGGGAHGGTRTDGALVRINKSDLSIHTQLLHKESTTPSEIETITQDGGHVYTGNSRLGQSGSPPTGHRSVIKWNKSMLTTGTSGTDTIAASALTAATITPTTAATTRVLTASGDTVGSNSYLESTSGCLMSALVTIGNTAPASYDSTDRILRVVQTETPYEDSAEIILNNSDQVLSDDDWRGVLVNLGFGFGSEVSYIPDLYVAAQEDISIAGVLYTRLLCIGNWGKLYMHKVMGDAPDAALDTGALTIKEIIEARLLSNMALVVDTSDGTQDTKVPVAVYPVYTDRRTVIQECNGLTTNLLFMRGADMHMIKKDNSQQHRIVGTISGTFVKGETITQATSGATGQFVYQSSAYIVVEAQTGTFSSTYTCTGGVSGATVTSPSSYDAFDYLYGPLAGDHTFYSAKRAQSLLTANRVIAVDAMPDTSGTRHTYPSSATYYADDSTDQAVFGINTLIFEDPSISSDALSQAAADARLLHIQQEAVGGVVTAPMNCGTEMYDYVQIDDDRAGWTSGSELALRVSRIVRRYMPGVYTIELGFGGLDWDTPENYDMKSLIDAATMEVTRGPEGVVMRDKPPVPPPAIRPDAPTGLEGHHATPTPPQERPRVPTANLPGQRITGFLGGQVSQEQSDISLGGVRRRLAREKLERDKAKESAKELAAKVWANVTKGLKF